MTTTETVTRERPILFSAPMIRALLDGRKTQTRRPFRVQPLDVIAGKGEEFGRIWYSLLQRDPNRGGVFRCRYGATGDRLWVRETHAVLDMRPDIVLDERAVAPVGSWPASVEYQADDSVKSFAEVEPTEWRESYDADHVIWRPSIHMPRWACRLVLELTEVRVERLQDISIDDVLAEGVERDDDEANGGMYWREQTGARYAALWDSLNASRGFGWTVNPWVWCLTFRQVAP